MQNYDQAAMLSCQQDPPGVIKTKSGVVLQRSAWAVSLRHSSFSSNFNTDILRTDTYILACYPEPPIGLQTSLVYICGTFSSIIHYSVILLKSLIVTPAHELISVLTRSQGDPVLD